MVHHLDISDMFGHIKLIRKNIYSMISIIYNMCPNPFYLGPIDAANKDHLFIDREGSLEYVKERIGSEGECIVILGEKGVGKTSFLNIIKAWLEEKAEYTTGRKILDKISRENTRLLPVPDTSAKIEHLLVDDIAFLDDSEAARVYEAIDSLLTKNEYTCICLTDRAHRGENVLKLRKEVSTGTYIDLAVSPNEMENFLRQRLKNTGYHDNFEHDGVYVAARRAFTNLREFFKYCREAYRLVDKNGKIGKELMFKAIWTIDRGYLQEMDKVARGVLSCLHERASSGGIPLMLLSKYAEETLGISRSTLYHRLNILQDYNMIVVTQKGREAFYNTIYNIIEMPIDPKQIINPPSMEEAIQEIVPHGRKRRP